MKLREVGEAAKLDGLEIPYPDSESMSHAYGEGVNGLPHPRRNRRAQSRTESPPPASPPADPFSNLREQREKKKQFGFEYDPFSIDKNLIG